MVNKSEKENYDFCQQTIELKEDIENQFLVLGQRLLQIREKRLYEAGYETFDLFSMELKMSGSTISKLINIYALFILKYGFEKKKLTQAGGWTVVAEVLPLIKTKEDAKYWLNKASLYSRQDLRIALTEKKTGVDQVKCKHKDSYTITICRTCALRQKIDEAKPAKK